MNKLTIKAAGFLLSSGCLVLTGCFGLFKPDASAARHFILTPVARATPGAAAPPLAMGVGQVKVPNYLFESSIAVRKGTNEVGYLPMILWAERLDAGLQRVLAANLAALLPADQVRLSAWQSNEVAAGVYVTIEQFDVDAGGHGVLAAWWRIMSPDGAHLLKAGQTRLTRDGPPPASDPQGAVANLSELIGELSRQLAPAIREATVRR